VDQEPGAGHDRVEPNVFADEVLELAGGDFAEALEAGDLVGGTALELKAKQFLTFDGGQSALAKAVGLKVKP